ncbi:hypothetical protein [Hymenobacter volaticus]|uniref:Uncharacterized protein n=1 Tax=Hymenobacter volaticus TaxID=2932254 RepID=A0ABY4GG53_9BACT|nr:hypothetical protein [Hymenobacter volaticus]UOQ69957.1 hypothetical protein MUN86_30710 [Hymenobacter volaticus]
MLDTVTLADIVEGRRLESDFAQVLLAHKSRRLPAAQQQEQSGQNFSRSFGR